ncbi:uncharacterized protein [Coffea arabica]|uniref:RNase H type-1 domain-containing protein n=1 Tax=Coffea arabica TaxID=13443 RepID=A0ABM4UYJ6_COFAR
MPSKCPFCPNEDTLDHGFVSCQVADQVWSWFERTLGLPARDANGLLLKLQGWWMHSSGSLRGTLFHLLSALICCELWKARNKAVYEDLRASPAQIRHRIVGLLNDIVNAHPFPSSASQESPLRLLGLNVPASRLWRTKCFTLIWSLPPYLDAKLNVDGSFLGNPGSSGDGGILGDHTGRVLMAFSFFYGFCTNMEAKAKALLEGLRQCLTLGLPQLIVQMDSKQLLCMVQQTSVTPWKLDTTIRRVRQLLTTAPVTLELCYRELNSAADALAKHAAMGGQSATYDASTLPPNVKGISALDAQ